jgi:3-deoxy-manno-octulosonate cytidylyltransferase (CMP-KDO synthetase)
VNPIVLIPSRLHSTRLPEKPLADIHGEPMIVHVWRRALEADLGPVVVATDHPRIAAAIHEAGGKAVMTRADHASGTDRIAEALGLVDPELKHDVIVNFQGDLPTVAPHVCRMTAALLRDAEVSIGTPVARIVDPAEADLPSVVKMVGAETSAGRFRALYFTRSRSPWGEGPLYHHIGLYAWRRDALETFVRLPPSPLEQRERLEQLRALEAGMRIDAIMVEDVPLGVDTEADLFKARALLSP